MKIRIKFSKYGPVRFVGHLDVMRYFQKLIRRADIDIAMTDGFSPHQIMSFANPLSVGISSDAEYVDIDINSMSLLSFDDNIKNMENLEELVQNLNCHGCEGFDIISACSLHEWQPGEKKQTAMSLVRAADYIVQYKPAVLNVSEPVSQNDINSFFKKDEIFIIKEPKTKAPQKIKSRHDGGIKSEQSAEAQPCMADMPCKADIKPLIIKTASAFDKFYDKDDANVSPKEFSKLHIGWFDENSPFCIMRLSTGSANNLKPEAVMKAFCDEKKMEYRRSDFKIHRIEQYGQADDGKFTSLDLMTI